MQPLLLLHGAIGAMGQLVSLADELHDSYKVFTLNFSGHGGAPYPENQFSIKTFAEDVLAFMEREQLDKVSIFGYSMGGYVAMYLAKHYPDKVDKIVTLATKFYWDEETSTREIKMLNADKIADKLPDFASTLERRHQPNDWAEVLQRTADMLVRMGKDNPLHIDDYTSIEHPSMILIGDRDKMITLEETIAIYKQLPNAHMGMLPKTHHPIEQVNVPYLVYYIKQFVG